MTRASLRSGSRFALGLTAWLLLTSSTAQAVETFEGFDDVASLTSRGWTLRNLSDPLGFSGWFQGDDAEVFPAQAGPSNSYLAANFDNVDLAGTISNWAITPTLTYSDGDTFSFYSRTVEAPQWPDRLEVRLSTNGSSDDVGNSALSVGDFSTLLLTINPDLTVEGYPQEWTSFQITLSGLGSPTVGRIAFRYFVTDAGDLNPNGDYIGIDTLRITTAVPEPSTWVMSALAIVPLRLAAKRRRHARRAA